MKQNKIISTAIAATLLSTSGIAVMASNNSIKNNENNQGNTIKATFLGSNDSFSLSIDSVGVVNAFYVSIDVVKLSGDIAFNSNCYKLGNENVTAKQSVNVVNGSDDKITIKIAVVANNNGNLSDKDGNLNLGTINLSSGSKDSEYRIDHIEVQTSTGTNPSEASNNLNEDSRKAVTLNKDINTGGSTGGGSSSGGSGGGSSKPEEEKPEDYNVQLFSMSGKDRYETSTKISKTGWSSGAKNVVIVNGNEKNMVDGLSATPFATIKDAPLLLSNGKTLPASTISELKRLNPTNVYVIGGTASMPESVVSSIKSNTKATVTRIGGSTRYETSLEIAKQIDKIADVSKVYISSGTGEVDALSIASVAGREKAPILLTNVNSIDNKTYDFIRSESIKDAYFIGGDKKISNSVINQVDKVVSADVSKNRVAGRNRKDTNAAIIKKFYTGSKLNGVVVSKDDVIIDALTVGSFAAKNDMPVVIGRESLSTSQKNVLSSKNTEKVYQAGGGVKTSVINNLKELLGTKK
ncbi:cell wall-binding repeat-containing protein [Peptacetobacter hiranonis]|nr:cell wall-binding repeat-containing protein [Peptacetobacter hiranonis]QEK20567.1 N-acetylmuramoyl-L-alanine amidase LytC [Peptacetobacter hiranonis]